MTVVTRKNEIVALPNDQDASGRSFGAAEVEAVAQALKSGTLTSTKGSFVKRLEQEFAALLGVKHAFACSSGTAAIHVAVAALDLEPGDEIVTTAITDMGALTPMLYQGVIPVFADVERDSLNVTCAAVERVLSPRTKAIMATHLFGNPCEIAALRDLAAKRGIALLEDCAQSLLARAGGRFTGTFGRIACFSLQQGKHITCGEGGLVATDDDALARRMFLFINKAWGYGDPKPDHYFMALNYRMSELQGAVAVAQLPRLPEFVAHRQALATRLTAALAGAPGVTAPRARPGDQHAWWRYCVAVDPAVIPGGPTALAKELKAYDVATAPRYIQKPAFDCAIFREQRTLGSSHWPFTLARKEAVDYAAARFPGTYGGLERALVLPWNERFEQRHVDYLAGAVNDAARKLAGGAS